MAVIDTPSGILPGLIILFPHDDCSSPPADDANACEQGCMFFLIRNGINYFISGCFGDIFIWASANKAWLVDPVFFWHTLLEGNYLARPGLAFIAEHISILGIS